MKPPSAAEIQRLLTGGRESRYTMIMDHLRFSGLSFEDQRAAFETFVRGEPYLMEILERLGELDLPDWWMVSGVLYNNVWNHLTGRSLMTGVKDVDVFYFDNSDLSYEAEDIVIRRAAPLFADLPVPVEIRNQARVHLWYEDHFGHGCAPILSSRDAIDGFAAKTHAVGVHLEADDALDIYAPYGLDDIFSFRLVPNHVNDNRATYAKKAERVASIWPEVSVTPW